MDVHLDEDDVTMLARTLHHWQRPMLLHDPVATAMTRLVSRMVLDDALLRGWQWRLEYLQLLDGFPHYRLIYRNDWVVGLVDVRSPAKLPVIHRDLGALLAGYGWTPHKTRLVEYGARTPIDASKHYLPHLFPSKESFAGAPTVCLN